MDSIVVSVGLVWCGVVKHGVVWYGMEWWVMFQPSDDGLRGRAAFAFTTVLVVMAHQSAEGEGWLGLRFEDWESKSPV